MLANVGLIFVFVKELLLVQGRVKRLVIVHLKYLDKRYDLKRPRLPLGVPRWIVNELCVHLTAFISLDLNNRRKGYGF